MSEKFKVLNLEMLESLKMTEEVSPGLLRSLVETFHETSLENFNKIEEGLEHKNFETIWKAAHSLKSSSGALGANAVSTLSLQIEKKGISKDLENLSELVTQLKKSRENALSELVEYLSHHSL